MKVLNTPIEGLLVVENRVFHDERGFFFEIFSEKNFKEQSVPNHFVQDNFSRSKKGVLRGLHFQQPNAQAKLVRVLAGAVWDVAVDLRPGSMTYGQHFGIELTGENMKALYVPEGFAHGFCVLSDSADFHYKCSALYSPKDEKGLMWNDPDLKIDWPVKNPIVSPKDEVYPSFAEFTRKLKEG